MNGRAPGPWGAYFAGSRSDSDQGAPAPVPGSFEYRYEAPPFVRGPFFGRPVPRAPVASVPTPEESRAQPWAPPERRASGETDFGSFFSDLFSGGQVVAIPTPVDGYRDGGGVNMNVVIGAAAVGLVAYFAWRQWGRR